jgi:hypothetical protein
MTAARRNKSGHIAIEIVAAIAILGIMGFGAFGMYQFGINSLRVSTERTLAVRALANEAERLRAEPLSELPANDETSFQVVMPELEELTDMTTSIRVESPEDATGATVITLSIRWYSHANRVISEQLTTLRAY